MNEIKIIIWGRELRLPIEYEIYTKQDILPSQIEAIEALKTNIAILESAKQSISAYCMERNGEDIGEKGIDNLFRYVAPEYFFVSREKEKHVIALMCKYKFDIEHGIAVVFENEQFVGVMQQDEIL